MTLVEMRKFLAEYDGTKINIMEVCGSHTAAITKHGIRELLSPNIQLISGPGCPVCVTTTAYIDRLIELAQMPNTCVVTFGDLFRVSGSAYSLSEIQSMGGRVVMVYSPMEILTLAEQEPKTLFVFAALGFETTTPIYAILMDEIIEKKIKNIKLLTALKTMPPVIRHLCDFGASMQGYLAPGHVAAITGSDVFLPLAEKYQIPFAVSGFEGEEILRALCGIVMNYGEGKVLNFYPSVVSAKGNIRAKKLVEKYFCKSDASWRGMGMVAESGMELRPEYERYDAGSRGLFDDKKRNKACCCDKVLMGNMQPQECPLFGKTCKPLTPQGACMVSQEGSCHAAFGTWSYFA